jgi:DivIVA domain-containing protein
VSRPATAAEIRAARFDKRMRGYALREVDQALQTAAADLEQQFRLTPARSAELCPALDAHDHQRPEVTGSCTPARARG